MARKFLNGIDLNNKQIQNLADGSAPTDAVTKQQLDAAIRGLDWKQEVVAASTANVSLTAPGTSIDGVTLTANDRILLKDQTAAAENGVYVWNGGSTALARANDSDTGARLSGSTYTVQRGTVNADRVYRVLTDDAITVGTTAITFGQVGGGTTPYTAGNGLTLSGQSFAVVPGNGILADGTSTRVDPSVVTRKASFSCAATTNPQTFTHSLGTQDVQVEVREVSTNALVLTDCVAPSTTTVSVDFGGAPSAGQYRVTVMA